MNHKPRGVYEKFIKRPLDLICAVLVLLLFWWVYVIVALLVRTKLGSPVLFRQDRPGKDGKIFKLMKFRSMTDERDENGKLLPDEVRLTGFGRLLRSTSLDELPEVFNIIRGDMSIIGPRPLLVRYLPLYSAEQNRRHEVRPGLTGWAQAHGRNLVSWEDKFKYDVWYADNITFANDMKVLFLTARSVLKREGISGEGSATMEEFKGSAEKSEEPAEV